MACYVATQREPIDPAAITAQAMEIAEAALWPVAALPPGTVRSVHSRLREMSGEAAIAVEW